MRILLVFAAFALVALALLAISQNDDNSIELTAGHGSNGLEVRDAALKRLQEAEEHRSHSAHLRNKKRHPRSAAEYNAAKPATAAAANDEEEENNKAGCAPGAPCSTAGKKSVLRDQHNPEIENNEDDDKFENGTNNDDEEEENDEHPAAKHPGSKGGPPDEAQRIISALPYALPIVLGLVLTLVGVSVWSVKKFKPQTNKSYFKSGLEPRRTANYPY